MMSDDWIEFGKVIAVLSSVGMDAVLRSVGDGLVGSCTIVVCNSTGSWVTIEVGIGVKFNSMLGESPSET